MAGRAVELLFAKMELGKDTELEPGTVETVKLTTAPEVERDKRVRQP